jgi:hypothetical protein
MEVSREVKMISIPPKDHIATPGYQPGGYGKRAPFTSF